MKEAYKYTLLSCSNKPNENHYRDHIRVELCGKVKT